MKEKNEKYLVQNNFLKARDVTSRLRVGSNDDNDDIFISFFIPTLNRTDTLIEAVESILNLSMIDTINYEIIVVDNSTDFTELNENYLYFKKISHPRIKYYINEKNIGLFNNWNRGIELAKGKYFAMLHDDDVLHKNYLVEMLKCIDNANNMGNLGFIHVKKKTFYSSKEIPDIDFKRRGGIRKIRMVDSIIDGVGPTCAPTCGSLFLRSALIDSGGYDDFLYPSADHIIGFLIMEKGYKGYITEDCLGYYRVAKNLSLSPETIKNIIKKDYYISNAYMYKITTFSKLFGLTFNNVQYSSRVNLWVYLVKNKYKVDLSINDLDFRKTYKKYNFNRFLLRIISILNNRIRKTYHN